MDGLPVDKGWAWMILVGASISNFVYGGVSRSSGLFFVQFQERFRSTATTTTIIHTVFNICTCVSGVLVMTVGMNHVSVRTSVWLGGVLASAAYAVSAYVQQFSVTIVAVGGMAGVAMSMFYLPILSTVGLYFNKRRGLANSVNAATASLGGLVFGPLYTLLFDFYGFNGTLLIASGLLLHILVAGSLMRSPDFYVQKLFGVGHPPHSITSINDSCADKKRAFTATSSVLITTDTYQQASVHVLPRLNNSPSAGEYMHVKVGMLSLKNNTSHEAESQERNLDVMINLLSPVPRSANVPAMISSKDGDSSFGKHGRCIGRITSVVCLLKTIFDTSLLNDRVFIHFICFASISFPPCMMTPTYCVPFAKDTGVSGGSIGTIVFVMGCMDLVGRAAAGIVADKKCCRPTTIVAIVFLAMAAVNSLARLVMDLQTLLVFVVVQALLSGVYVSLFAVILAENVGQSRLKSALGFTNMFHGVAVAVMFPITGLLRDISGAYYWTYHLLSGLQVAGAALAFTLPITYRRNRNSA